jgi:hypothetical protein
MQGVQRRFVCPNCGKVFFAWRPETAPGQKIKCYFCKKEMEDEAARRAPAVPVAPAVPAAQPAAASAAAAPAPQTPAATPLPDPTPQ